MFLKTSRYALVARFEPDPDGRTDFRGVKPRPIAPAAGVLEHTQTESDRPDLLARDYYQADRAWFRILDANVEYVIAGPIRDAEDNRVTAGDSLNPDSDDGDVMISDRMQGDAILIPAKKG
jgi:hypothetical protein